MLCFLNKYLDCLSTIYIKTKLLKIIEKPRLSYVCIKRNYDLARCKFTLNIIRESNDLITINFYSTKIVPGSMNLVWYMLAWLTGV